MRSPPPVPASWMPSPPEAEDAPSASVTTGTGDSTRLQPPRLNFPHRPAGESLGVCPLPQYQPPNGVNGTRLGTSQSSAPLRRGPGIVPSRNPIPACKQSPEEGRAGRGWGGCTGGSFLSQSLPLPPSLAGDAGTSSRSCCHLLDNQRGGGGFCFHSDKCVSIQHLGQKDHHPSLPFCLLDPMSPSLRPWKRGQKTFGFYLVETAFPW